jgi:hypothetical protein
MNTPELTPTATCLRLAPLLARGDDPEVDASAAAELRRHLHDCRYCRAHQGQYADLDAALRRHFGLASVLRHSTEELMQHIDERASEPRKELARPAPPPHRPAPKRTLLSSLAAVAAVLLLIAFATFVFSSRLGTSLGAHSGPPQYSFPGTRGLFASVSMVSPNEGWALAQVTRTAQNDTRPLDEVTFYHYQNGAWTPVTVTTSKDFSDGGVSGFNGTISMDSAADGWAVAHNFNRFSAVLHYSHGTWSEVPASDIATLQALSPRSVWAIAGEQDGGRSNTLVHYDGTAWTPQTIGGVPGGSTVDVRSLSMLSESDGWALISLGASRFALARYDGASWRIQTVFSDGETADFSSITAASPTEAWILGQKIVADAGGNTAHMPLKQVLYHYNYAHDAMSQIALPIASQGYTTLYRVVMVAPNDGWIIGAEQAVAPGTTTSGYEQHTTMFHYTSGQWERVGIPSNGAAVAQITDLSFTADGHAWACGYVSDIPASQVVQDTDILAQASPLLWSYQNGAWAMYLQK